MEGVVESSGEEDIDMRLRCLRHRRPASGRERHGMSASTAWMEEARSWNSNADGREW